MPILWEHRSLLAHLVRDLRFVENAHGHVWAKRLGHLLSGTCRRVSEIDAKALDEAERFLG